MEGVGGCVYFTEQNNCSLAVHRGRQREEVIKQRFKFRHNLLRMTQSYLHTRQYTWCRHSSETDCYQQVLVMTAVKTTMTKNNKQRPIKDTSCIQYKCTRLLLQNIFIVLFLKKECLKIYLQVCPVTSKWVSAISRMIGPFKPMIIIYGKRLTNIWVALDTWSTLLCIYHLCYYSVFIWCVDLIHSFTRLFFIFNHLLIHQ